MSTKINIHNVVEVREQISHYTNNIKFICRTIYVVDADQNEVEINFYTDQDELAVLPAKTTRTYSSV